MSSERRREELTRDSLRRIETKSSFVDNSLSGGIHDFRVELESTKYRGGGYIERPAVVCHTSILGTLSRLQVCRNHVKVYLAVLRPHDSILRASCRSHPAY